MRSIEFELNDGISVGDKPNKSCGLREPTAADVQDASEASEQLVLVPAGYDSKNNPISEPQLVASPTRTAMNILRLQITHIGEFKAPIEPEIFRKLSATDLELLQKKSMELEKVGIEVALRGRAEPTSASVE